MTTAGRSIIERGQNDWLLFDRCFDVVTRIHFALLHLHHQYKGDHFQSRRMMGTRVPTEINDERKWNSSNKQINNYDAGRKFWELKK